MRVKQILQTITIVFLMIGCSNENKTNSDGLLSLLALSSANTKTTTENAITDESEQEVPNSPTPTAKVEGLCIQFDFTTTPGASSYLGYAYDMADPFTMSFPYLDPTVCDGNYAYSYTYNYPTDEQIDTSTASEKSAITTELTNLCTTEEISNISKILDDQATFLKSINDSSTPFTYSTTMYRQKVQISELKNVEYSMSTPTISDSKISMVNSGYKYLYPQIETSRLMSTEEFYTIYYYSFIISQAQQSGCYSNYLNAKKDFFSKVAGYEPFFGLKQEDNKNPIFGAYSCSVYSSSATSTPNKCDTIQYPSP